LNPREVLSETGLPSVGSNGLAIVVNGPLCPILRNEILIICGGDNIAETTSPKIVTWLRRNARHGAQIGGMSTGPYALAKAGLLEGKKATLHWEYHDSFRELFPEIQLLDTIYYVDENRFTCAGCAASMDMMLHLIAKDWGPDLASHVSDLMVYTAPREFGQSQRMSLQARSGTRHPKLSHCLSIMSELIEDPLSTSQIAEVVGISNRPLERLFRKYLNILPSAHYKLVRLQRARSLLLKTNLTVMEISIAVGFESRPHFTHCYRKSFGVNPSHENGMHSVSLHWH